MRFWFDTEFYEDGKTIELISIGIVSEDGRQYYAELPNSHIWARKSAWLADNVAPLLSGKTAPVHQIRADLIEFFGNNPEIWAYFGSYDWVALCQLYGTMMDLPRTWPMYVRDVKQLADSLAAPLNTKPEVAHNALSDARWARDAYKFLIRLDRDKDFTYAA